MAEMILNDQVVEKINFHWARKTSTSSGRKIILYTRSYGSTLDKAIALTKIAKRDFPSLKDEDIEILIYRGRFLDGLMGIEFDPMKWEIPAEYEDRKNHPAG